MATVLNRRVVRETADRDPGWHRPIMIELAEGGRFVHVWQKGRRSKYIVTYAQIWRLGYQAELARIRAEKQKGNR
jgi:hypothetical protein